MKRHLSKMLGLTLNFLERVLKAIFRNLIYDEEFLARKMFSSLNKSKNSYLFSRRYFWKRKSNKINKTGEDKSAWAI